MAREGTYGRRSGQQAFRDFAVAMTLMTVLPPLVVAYLARQGVFATTAGFSLYGALIAMPTLVLGLLGALIVGRYIRGSARLHSQLARLASTDIPRAAGILSANRAPWQLDTVAEMIIREYRKQILASQAEKAAVERRLLEITGRYTAPRGAR